MVEADRDMDRTGKTGTVHEVTRAGKTGTGEGSYPNGRNLTSQVIPAQCMVGEPHGNTSPR